MSHHCQKQCLYAVPGRNFDRRRNQSFAILGNCNRTSRSRTIRQLDSRLHIQCRESGDHFGCDHVANPGSRVYVSTHEDHEQRNRLRLMRMRVKDWRHSLPPDVNAITQMGIASD
eukprot:917424-Amphidinium_carterae.1